MRTDSQTHRQTDICLQKIYVEGPVQNNEKTKIENVVWIKITFCTGLKIISNPDYLPREILKITVTDGPLHRTRTQDTCRGNINIL